MKKVALLISTAALVAAGSMTALAADPTEITVWVANELHNSMFEFGEKAYNEAHPDAPVDVNVEVYANAEMAEKLLIALQSGTGAPDIADININYFANFCGEDCQLVELDDIVSDVIDDCIASRFEIYKFNDQYYGLQTHVLQYGHHGAGGIYH